MSSPPSASHSQARSRSQSLSIPPRLPSSSNGRVPPAATSLNPNSSNYATSLSSQSQTSEFQKAFQKHLRSTSMSGPHAVDTSSHGWASRVSGVAAGGEENRSPSSTASTESTESSNDSLPTPSSSPNPAGTALSGIGIGLGMFGVGSTGGANRPKSINTKESSIFETDEHEEAIEIEVGSPRSPSTTLFANGARWGWPQPSSSLSTSPPASSTIIGSPPSPPGSVIIGSVGRRGASVGSYGLTGAPLGRVSSNGQGGTTTMSTSQGAEGFGLFRKLSIGFGSKVSLSTSSSPTLRFPFRSSQFFCLGAY